ncbi:hypothetical protein [Kushneria phosphatilytica]|uniref:Uncharacterized protein n=1 Tax=Kushneria phosphatilytica TaxID=657387 RepID=A0A5C0ZVK4_9GAMM|nr:hypothetical protein [Kushneria phosphatilytica]QEL10048.1 hypothetical protein FY550_02140 [Kushneria phosphatilytica]
MTINLQRAIFARVAGRLKEEVGVVLFNERIYANGKREQLIARLRREKQLSREEAQREVDHFLNNS